MRQRGGEGCDIVGPPQRQKAPAGQRTMAKPVGRGQIEPGDVVDRRLGQGGPALGVRPIQIGARGAGPLKIMCRARVVHPRERAPLARRRHGIGNGDHQQRSASQGDQTQDEHRGQPPAGQYRALAAARRPSRPGGAPGRVIPLSQIDLGDIQGSIPPCPIFVQNGLQSALLTRRSQTAVQPTFRIVAR